MEKKFGEVLRFNLSLTSIMHDAFAKFIILDNPLTYKLAFGLELGLTF